MTSKRLFFVLISVAVLLSALIAGGVYGSNVVLTRKADDLARLKAESESMEQRHMALVRSKVDLKTYDDLNRIAQAIVPKDKDQTQTVREIIKIAKASGIPNLTSITFPQSMLGGVGGAKSTSKDTQVIPVKGMAGLYNLPITVTVDQDNAVSFDQLTAFLKGLEQNRRTAQVSSLQLTPDTRRPDRLTFSIIINEYVKQ